MSKSGFTRGNTFSEVLIEDDYLLKNRSGLLALRKFDDSTYQNIDFGQIACKGALAIDHQGDGIHLGADGGTVGPHAPYLPLFTTAQRNALTGIDGMIIWNITNQDMEYFVGGAWVKLLTGAADS